MTINQELNMNNITGPMNVLNHRPASYRALPYVKPVGIVTFRTFDDPTVAVEAHHRMEVRFDADASNDLYEG